MRVKRCAMCADSHMHRAMCIEPFNKRDISGVASTTRETPARYLAQDLIESHDYYSKGEKSLA